jgi:hypothetical protein
VVGWKGVGLAGDAVGIRGEESSWRSLSQWLPFGCWGKDLARKAVDLRIEEALSERQRPRWLFASAAATRR